MLMSTALGRVAGQRLYGVAQAALYRFEALFYAAAASRESYGERAAVMTATERVRKERPVYLSVSTRIISPKPGTTLSAIERSASGVLSRCRKAGSAGREDEIYSSAGPRRDGGAYFVRVVRDDFFVLDDAALHEGEPFKLRPCGVLALSPAPHVADCEHGGAYCAPYLGRIGDAEKSGPAYAEAPVLPAQQRSSVFADGKENLLR